MLASSDPVAMSLFYHQAVEDVSKGKIPSGEKLTQLRLLKAGGKKEEVCVYGCVCVCVCVCDHSLIHTNSRVDTGWPYSCLC